MRKRDASTLTELLVVISVIALLMAILLPCLQQVRRQAKAVACQSNLRQWGTFWATWTNDNGGFFPGQGPEARQPSMPDGSPTPTATPSAYIWPWGWGWDWGFGYDLAGFEGTEAIWCCPVVTKIADPTGVGGAWDPSGGVNLPGDPAGGSFLAWGRIRPKGEYPWDNYGSYGFNASICKGGDVLVPHSKGFPPMPIWTSPYVKGASNIPLLLDGTWHASGFNDEADSPPICDAVPNVLGGQHPGWFGAGTKPGIADGGLCFCINRHDGHVNGLFFDFAVRKVGLKELWTLKWHEKFDTAGRRTKAGGRTPAGWPEWMRNFKDY